MTANSGADKIIDTVNINFSSVEMNYEDIDDEMFDFPIEAYQIPPLDFNPNDDFEVESLN